MKKVISIGQFGDKSHVGYLLWMQNWTSVIFLPLLIIWFNRSFGSLLFFQFDFIIIINEYATTYVWDKEAGYGSTQLKLK